MRKIFITLLIISSVLSGTAAAATTSSPSAASAAVTPTAAAVPANIAIGIIDIDKIMNDSPVAKAMQEQLNKTGADLNALLSSEKPNLTDEQYRTKQEAYYTKYLQIKQDVQARLDASVNKAIAQVAKEKNLYMVIYKSGVALGGVDITADVISKM